MSPLLPTPGHAWWCCCWRCAAIFPSYRDVAQCLRLCVTAPDTLRFGVFFCISNNSRGYRDIEHTREVLGYEPQDSADDFEF